MIWVSARKKLPTVWPMDCYANVQQLIRKNYLFQFAWHLNINELSDNSNIIILILLKMHGGYINRIRSMYLNSFPFWEEGCRSHSDCWLRLPVSHSISVLQDRPHCRGLHSLFLAMPYQLDSSFTQLPEGEMADSLTNKLANGAITEYTDVPYIDWNTYIKHKVIYTKKY